MAGTAFARFHAHLPNSEKDALLFRPRPLDDDLSLLNDASLGGPVPWTVPLLDDQSLGRCASWTTSPLDGATLERGVPWTTRPLDGGSLERRGSFRMRPLVDASLTNVCNEISWKVSIFCLFTTHSVCGKNQKPSKSGVNKKKNIFF